MRGRNTYLSMYRLEPGALYGSGRFGLLHCPHQLLLATKQPNLQCVDLCLHLLEGKIQLKI